MLYIKKDKSSWASYGYPIPMPDDCYVVADPNLERLIMTDFPDIDLVVENGELVDIVSTKESEPSVEERIKTLEEGNQMLTDCILEMSEIVYG